MKVYTNEIDISIFNFETGKSYSSEEEMLNGIREQRLKNIIDDKDVIVEKSEIEPFTFEWKIKINGKDFSPIEIKNEKQFKEIFDSIKKGSEEPLNITF